MPREVAEKFRVELTRLAENPTSAEQREEVDELAKEALDALWLWLINVIDVNSPRAEQVL